MSAFLLVSAREWGMAESVMDGLGAPDLELLRLASAVRTAADLYSWIVGAGAAAR